MPSQPPGTITFGIPGVLITISYNPSTLAFNNPAVVCVNTSGVPQSVQVTNSGTNFTGTYDLPAGTTNITPQMLRNKAGINSWADVDGFSIAQA